MKNTWIALFAALSLTAGQASAYVATVHFSGADIVALSPTTVNVSGTPVIGDGSVQFTGGTRYTTYSGSYLNQSAFNEWINTLSSEGHGVSWFNLWLQDGASNQAAMWGETIALTDPYSADIHPFASAGWNAYLYTIGNEWGSVWVGKKLIQFWSVDPDAYLSLGTTATFGFTADIMGNDGATGPDYQMWIGGGTDDTSVTLFQRAITAHVPEPASLVLFGLALSGLAALRRRQPD